MIDLIGIRLKALRESRKLSQDELARMFGFKDRQIVSAIENGERRLSADELLRAMTTLKVPLEYFTDPFLLVGEGQFSWRQSVGSVKSLDKFEQSAGRTIAAYRKYAPEVGKGPEILRPSLRLTAQSTFEQAIAGGERFVKDYKLGDVPAARLAQVMEDRLGILVLMVDAINGISGAACRVRDLDAVLINRNEVVGRRNFDLAHELFHILTWEAMPPAHVEDASEGGAVRRGGKRTRVEQLADNFAGAVLMPRKALERLGPWDKDLAKQLNKTALELGVSATALKWRLVAAELISKADAEGISEAALRNNGRGSGKKAELPPLFSKAFMEVISLALMRGLLSMRRAAELLSVTVDDIPDLCAAYGLDAPDEL
jgi:Zn-dependent peptidase ImmA (M78 family)/transcriptional regulator with XRE-family HTH domain